MGYQDDFLNGLKDGEKADYYNKPPGLFGRTFQEPDGTVERHGNRYDFYDKPPGLFGRTFQEPDRTMIKSDSSSGGGVVGFIILLIILAALFG